MKSNVVDMKKYKEDKLADAFYAACLKSLNKGEVPSKASLKEAK